MPACCSQARAIAKIRATKKATARANRLAKKGQIAQPKKTPAKKVPATKAPKTKPKPPCRLCGKFAPQK